MLGLASLAPASTQHWSLTPVFGTSALAPPALLPPGLIRTLAPPPGYPAPTPPILPLIGALSRSSVKENPSTQPFNNTSVILGITYWTSD
jgi:hypothetical protein